MKALIVFWTSLAAIAVQAGTFTIAVRGKPADCTVVVPPNANECVRNAAHELAAYCERMTGVKLPVATARPASGRRVELVLAPGIANDGFALKVAGDALTIAASVDRGLLYGVYEILETYAGCAWYSSWMETVPTLEAFGVPDDLNRLETPDFEVREPFAYDVNRNAGFAAKVRKNASMFSPNGIPAKFGGAPYRYGATLWGHTFSRIIPPKKYFDSHPEYFSEIDGVRVKAKTQLCLSNPEVVQLYVTNMLKRVREDPNGFVYGIGHDDCRQRHCHCAKCQAIIDAEGCVGAPEFLLANAVGEAMEKEFPGRYVSILSYEASRKPPKTIRLRPNVILNFCPIEGDFSEPFAKGTGKANRQIAADLDGWMNHCDRVMVWDYITNFENYLGVFPNICTLQDNLRFFRDHRTFYVCEEGGHTAQHTEFAELKTYLLAKLMWKLEQPIWPIIEKFCRGYYGEKAAPFVMQYIREMQSTNAQRDHEKNPLTFNELFTTAAVTDEFLERGLRLWKDAESAVSGDKQHTYNVRMGAMSVVMMILQRQAFGVCVRKEDFPSKRLRKLSAWALRRIAECPKLAMKEGGMDANFVARLKRIADPNFSIPGGTKAVVEFEDVFKIWGSFNTKLVEDARASGGKAVRFPNNFSGDKNWIGYFPMACFGYEPGVRYRFRLRVRAERPENAPDGNMIKFGRWSHDKKECFDCPQVAASQIGTEYQWIDLLAWAPDDPQSMLYIAGGVFSGSEANPSFTNFWADQVEVERIGE